MIAYRSIVLTILVLVLLSLLIAIELGGIKRYTKTSTIDARCNKLVNKADNVKSAKKSAMTSEDEARSDYLRNRGDILMAIAIGSGLTPGVNQEEYKANFQSWWKANADNILADWVYKIWYKGMTQIERDTCKDLFGVTEEGSHPLCVLSYVCPTHEKDAKSGCLCWDDPTVAGCTPAKERSFQNYFRPIAGRRAPTESTSVG